MQLPKFISFANNGAGFILCTSPPGYYGKVVRFESADEMTDFVMNKKHETGICIAGKVPKHSILIIYSGDMEKNNVLPESVRIFSEMALFYYETRIKEHERKFKKYLETAH